MRKFEVNGKIITQNSKPWIIAEIGNNHNGSVNLCKHLITEAKKNGADAVKLQKRCPEKLFTKALFDSPYPGRNSFGATYGLHRKALEFDKSEWIKIVNHSEKEGIMLFATPFDDDSVDFLEQFDPPAYKIASGCLTDIPLIEKIAKLGKPMIVSTGGGSWNDVDRAYQKICRYMRHENFCFLHCVASYPNRAEDMNLNLIPEMIERYPYTMIGLSDHYQGYNMALAAYCMGARVFEKHFTSDHTLPGPDHALSIESHELCEWVHEMERLRAAMGDGDKVLRDSERKGIHKMGKSVKVVRPVPKGKVVEADDVAIKSPSGSIMPYEKGRVIGRIAARNLSTADDLKWGDLE